VIGGYERAKLLLTGHQEALIRIAEALLDRESLDAAEIRLLIAGQPLEERRPRKSEAKPEKPNAVPAKNARPAPIPPQQERPAPA
jgi:cell division protease FtsH